jgi:hypothetical protein
MSGNNTFEGGCHCGAVRYRVGGLDLGNTITCNCSRCSKLGHILSFVPADSFSLLSGEEYLTDYQFNKKVIHHLFCNICGIQSFGRGVGKDGAPTVAVNVRCLDDIDIDQVVPQKFDGKNY